MDNIIKKQIGALHEQVWTRFIHKPFGIVLDYADATGHTVIPEPEHCERAMPNPFSWWTPIENGAFFTGLYLGGLAGAYCLSRDRNLEREIITLIKGLFRLQDVGKTPGFIARGVASDGVSHYPFGSDDQTAPWAYGLWKAWHCEFLSNELKDEIKTRLLYVIEQTRKTGWRVPTEWEGKYNGGYLEGGFRAVSRLLFFCRIAAELSGSPAWSETYRELLHSVPRGGVRTRLEICGDGFAVQMIDPAFPSVEFWIYTCAQACLRELCDLEEETDIALRFRQGLSINGAAVLPYLSGYLDYDNESDLKFDVDWRCLEPTWKEHSCVDGARRHAEWQERTWTPECVPKRPMEHRLAGNVLFGNWIAQLSGNEKLRAYAKERLTAAVQHIKWETMHLSYAFAAQCAAYESLSDLPR